jgi:hypothetical protein
MPTRKQKRRDAKSKRHEYEFVYVDDEGNEVEAPDEPAPTRSSNGTRPAAKKSAAPARRTRLREPQPPSWQRAGRRAIILGACVFVLFTLTAKGSNRYVTALVPAVIYTALFIPFTFAIDRFAYRRYQARQQQPTATKKR